jgi:hypothetical protein
MESMWLSSIGRGNQNGYHAIKVVWEDLLKLGYKPYISGVFDFWSCLGRQGYCV